LGLNLCQNLHPRDRGRLADIILVNQ